VLGRLLAACRSAQLAATLVLEATALLRLYAALRGIAGKANILLHITVLRIHAIFARIRIPGSMLLTTESGSCYFPATALLRLYAALRGIAGKPNIVVYGTM
jgi:hypothetical protein